MSKATRYVLPSGLKGLTTHPDPNVELVFDDEEYFRMLRIADVRPKPDIRVLHEPKPWAHICPEWAKEKCDE